MTPISRRDIIAIGGDFTIERFDASNLPRWTTTGNNIFIQQQLEQLDGKRVHVQFNDSRYSSAVLSTEEQDTPVALSMGTYFNGPVDAGRNRLASLVRPMDPEAAEALSGEFFQGASFNASKRERSVPVYYKDDLQDLGIDADAALYVAVDRQDLHAILHYLDMGADPVRATFDGDCAARLEMAHAGMIFDPETFNAQHLVSGDTGLHALSRMPGIMSSFVEHGANPHIANKQGISALDLVDPRDRKEVLEARALWEQRQLEANTSQIASWSPLPPQNPAGVVKDATPAQHQRLRPQRL